MPKNKHKKKPATPSWINRCKSYYSRLNLIQKLILLVVALFLFIAAFTYAGSVFYTFKHHNEPLKIGATFIPNYAKFYSLDPEETMDAMIYDLGLERLRLVSYWKDIEKVEGEYDFTELDWQFKKAEEANVEISLSIGLRQPRWPECHMPAWGLNTERSYWEPKLMKFIEATVNRYKDSPVLESYQLENEFFMTVFGECPDHSRDRLVAEYDLVKRLDPDTKLIITRSNNWGGVPIGEPTPDQFGISVYKRVWDKTLTKRYFEYPYPPWFYSSLAGYGELFSGKDMIIHELQTEAWLPDGYSMNRVSDIPEQNKSLNAERLKSRIEYGVNSGIRTIDLWGPEWWLWRKEKAGDPSLWKTAKAEIAKAKAENSATSDY